VSDALPLFGWVIEAYGGPEDTTVRKVFSLAQVFVDDIQDHFGAKLLHAWPTNPRELIGDLVGHRVLQCFRL
jgi:hypothetical protein